LRARLILLFELMHVPIKSLFACGSKVLIIHMSLISCFPGRENKK